ncbi:hypothetical protein [Agarilytica rhodophyticola]|uniref:hypothetical protein n=1 Tax=Agarilytica rhodophyticola TaxID=1737490 RepID=UPI000B3492BD|nr:hypothetical protein [Agarilytica rhodophyticola]
MAYDNPEDIRDNVVKVRLNDHDLKLLGALARNSRTQKATLAFEIIRRELQLLAESSNKNDLKTA